MVFNDFRAVVEKKVTLEEINNYMKEKQSDSYAYTEEEIVSSDIIGDTHGSIFDATQNQSSTIRRR